MRPLAPTFAFIDPFGPAGWPFSVVHRILSYPSCEVLVNFTYESINRFITHPNLESIFNELFGTDRWRDIRDCNTPRERLEFLNSLYREQLEEEAGAKHVRSFEMIDDGNHTEYFLFYATKDRTGLSRMKAAMWKVDPSGAMQFSDRTDLSQTILFGADPDLTQLKSAIEKWGTNVPRSIGGLEDFVLTKTAFRETHGRQVLIELEKEGRLEIVASRRKKARSYPAGTVFKILPADGS